MAEDQAHLETPLTDMIEEFLNVKEQYIELLEEYALHHAQAVTLT